MPPFGHDRPSILLTRGSATLKGLEQSKRQYANPDVTSVHLHDPASWILCYMTCMSRSPRHLGDVMTGTGEARGEGSGEEGAVHSEMKSAVVRRMIFGMYF